VEIALAIFRQFMACRRKSPAMPEFVPRLPLVSSAFIRENLRLLFPHCTTNVELTAHFSTRKFVLRICENLQPSVTKFANREKESGN
jgi:hypothetical protein